MSLLFPRQEKRLLDSTGWVPFNVGGINPSGIGVANALTLPPVFAAVRLLSDSISTLPLKAYRDVNDTHTQITAPQLIQNPAAVGNIQEWLSALVTSLASYGNAYGLITTRDGYFYPTTIEWISPESVQVDENKPTQPVYRFNGGVVPSEDVVHIRWMPVAGRVVSVSPIDSLKYAVATGLGAMQFKADWYRNGGTPPGTFKNNAREVPQDVAEQMKARLVAAIQKHQPLVYGSDWDYQPGAGIQADAFAETMKAVATQVATVYGVPATLIGGDPGGTLTYNNLQADGVAFVRNSLRPWLERIEYHLSALLPTNVCVRFDTDALERADIQTRWSIYQIQRNIGATSVNEIREKENESPIVGGDDYGPIPVSPPAPAQQSPTPQPGSE